MKFIANFASSLWLVVLRLALMLAGLFLLLLAQSTAATSSVSALLLLLGVMLFFTAVFFRLLAPWMNLPLHARHSELDVHDRPLRPPS